MLKGPAPANSVPSNFVDGDLMSGDVLLVRDRNGGTYPFHKKGADAYECGPNNSYWGPSTRGHAVNGVWQSPPHT